MQPRILVADRHPALVMATMMHLRSQFDVIGFVADGAALVAEATRLRPDIIVAEIDLPVLSGIDAVHQLRQSGSSSRIVFLSIHTEPEFINACMAAGALGYVLKSQMKANLIPAIQAAIAGTFYISPFAVT